MAISSGIDKQANARRMTRMTLSLGALLTLGIGAYTVSQKWDSITKYNERVRLTEAVEVALKADDYGRATKLLEQYDREGVKLSPDDVVNFKARIEQQSTKAKQHATAQAAKNLQDQETKARQEKFRDEEERAYLAVGEAIRTHDVEAGSRALQLLRDAKIKRWGAPPEKELKDLEERISPDTLFRKCFATTGEERISACAEYARVFPDGPKTKDVIKSLLVENFSLLQTHVDNKWNYKTAAPQVQRLNDLLAKYNGSGIIANAQGISLEGIVPTDFKTRAQTYVNDYVEKEGETVKFTVPAAERQRFLHDVDTMLALKDAYLTPVAPQPPVESNDEKSAKVATLYNELGDARGKNDVTRAWAALAKLRDAKIALHGQGPDLEREMTKIGDELRLTSAYQRFKDSMTKGEYETADNAAVEVGRLKKTLYGDHASVTAEVNRMRRDVAMRSEKGSFEICITSSSQEQADACETYLDRFPKTGRTRQVQQAQLAANLSILMGGFESNQPIADVQAQLFKTNALLEQYQQAAVTRNAEGISLKGIVPDNIVETARTYTGRLRSTEDSKKKITSAQEGLFLTKVAGLDYMAKLYVAK
jgi:hypothetical protein